jgi:hypothetical protein
MKGNKLNYCKECGQWESFHRNPDDDIKDINGNVVEYSYRCECGHKTVNPSDKYLEGVN